MVIWLLFPKTLRMGLRAHVQSLTRAPRKSSRLLKGPREAWVRQVVLFIYLHSEGCGQQGKLADRLRCSGDSRLSGDSK